MAKTNKAVSVERVRTTEEYLLSQFNYNTESESYRMAKDRMAAGDMLYRGDLAGLFPNEDALPDIPFVENKFKNALHDLARLASEGRGAVKAIPRGDKDKDMKGARRLEAINEGYWMVNRLKGMERKLYLDLAGSGMMALSAYGNVSQSPYPQGHHMNPRYGYPDVRNGKIQTYLQAEEVLERQLARQFPHLGLDDRGDNGKRGYFVCYYDEEAVYEAVLLSSSNSPTPDSAKIVNMWEHGLGCIPVAFEMLDTYDGAFHGLFEQLSGPLMVRNKTVRFLVDYLESIAHAPIVAKNVINAGDTPGPDVVYQLDPNAEDTSIGRLAPAAPANTVFGLLQYMQDQEEKESIQPPARAGNVSQSIASGSFVDRTQGQLTSVVKEMQDKMASVREQFNEICMKIDEQHLNFSKPLIRPVAGIKEYTPETDINGWYFHNVQFGAGAGLDRLNADTRILNHLGARLISRETARGEIDYLGDMADEQDKIDRENLADALLQRMVTDPTTPMHVIAETFVDMSEGGANLVAAMKKAAPQLVEAAQQQQAQQGTPAALPAGAEVPPEEGVPPGGPTPAEQELAQLQLQNPPILQLFNRNR